MTTLKLTDAIIRAGANEKSFARGQELYCNGAISDAAIQSKLKEQYRQRPALMAQLEGL